MRQAIEEALESAGTATVHQSMPLAHWFWPFLLRWLELNDAKLKQLARAVLESDSVCSARDAPCRPRPADGCVERAQLSPVRPNERYSASVVDLFAAMQQSADFAKSLAWDDPIMRQTLLQRLIGSYCEAVILYADGMAAMLEQRIQPKGPNAVVGFLSRWHLLPRSAPRVDPEIAEAPCVCLNNVLEARRRLDGLSKQLTAPDADADAALMVQTYAALAETLQRMEDRMSHDIVHSMLSLMLAEVAALGAAHPMPEQHHAAPAATASPEVAARPEAHRKRWHWRGGHSEAAHDASPGPSGEASVGSRVLRSVLPFSHGPTGPPAPLTDAQIDAMLQPMCAQLRAQLLRLKAACDPALARPIMEQVWPAILKSVLDALAPDTAHHGASLSRNQAQLLGRSVAVRRAASVPRPVAPGCGRRPLPSRRAADARL